MSGSTGLRWRPTTEADVSEIYRISKIIHPDIPERLETYRQKQQLSPTSCFVVCDGKSVRGYAMSLPWIAREIPKLDSDIDKTPANATALYIHDVALLPSVRSLGLVGELMRLFDEAGRNLGLSEMSLAAVYGSETTWFQYGFRRQEMSEKLKQQAATYGSAVFMTREIATGK